ncbi:hypothetical protein SBV1_gp14 [Sulfolobales Beppu virus 1]|nr:hypothetical protein SBV1_gp14 [Sulfolobales Beppu virus 1]
MYKLSIMEREKLVKAIFEVLNGKERLYNGKYVKIIGYKGTYLIAIDSDGNEVKIPYHRIRTLI